MLHTIPKDMQNFYLTRKPVPFKMAKTEITFLLCGIVLILSSVFSGVYAGFAVFALLTGVASVISPIAGSALWFMPAPFEAVTVVKWGFSPYIFVTPAFLIGFFVHILNRPNYKCLLVPSIIGAGFIVNAILSTIFTSNGPDIRSLISIAILTVCSVAGMFAVSNETNKSYLLLFGAVLSALGAVIYAVMLWDGSWRLTMTEYWGGGTRHLDTSVSIGLAICVSVLFSDKQRVKLIPFDRYDINKLYVAMVSVLLSVALFATVGRAAIVAILLGILAVGFLFGARALLVGVFPWRISIVALGSALLFFVVPVLDLFVTRGHIMGRMLLMLKAPGENVRWEIWNTALNNLAGHDWIIGAGLGKFRELAGNSPHSVYVNVLVEMGVSGMFFVLFAFFFIALAGIKKGGIPFVMFLIFFAFSFLTKGSLYNKYFYFSFVIAWALAATIKKRSLPIDLATTESCVAAQKEIWDENVEES